MEIDESGGLRNYKNWRREDKGEEDEDIGSSERGR
jgi:hypothetical protein